MFSKITKFFMAKKWLLIILVLALGGGGYYFYKAKATTAATPTYAVVGTVSKGEVSSGIVTTGTIAAAQKLSLDVYKQSRRIVAVNVKNAGHVAAGTILYSFDKSGAYVDVQASQVAIAQAQLDLATAQANYTDPNTTLRTLQNNLVTYHTDIVDAEKSLEQAKRDFYNANLSVESGNSLTKDKHRPTLSGVYNGTAVGSYRIKVYGSLADSGYSYNVTGLESGTQSVLNVATPVGTQGLKIIFPSDIRSGDEWVVSVPNTAASEYIKNKETYDTAVRTLNEKITSANVSIANTETDIKKQSQTDATPYRDLGVTKAEATLAANRQQLSQHFDVVKEQDIIAPFAGTVEGIENVVVGASPTGATNDSISLGTLISDQFLVNFSLNAVDVAKVAVGQRVIVKVTSFPSAQPIEAAITQISSLPESSGVAQYAVQALITQSSSSPLTLREGLLADVEVVDRNVADAVRIPVSALSYENGKPTVQVIGDLSADQKTTLDKMGVIKSVSGSFPSYAVPVEVGIVGAFYAEIKSGLKEGDHIIVSKTDNAASVVQQNGFGPGARRATTGASATARSSSTSGGAASAAN